MFLFPLGLGQGPERRLWRREESLPEPEGEQHRRKRERPATQVTGPLPKAFREGLSGFSSDRIVYGIESFIPDLSEFSVGHFSLLASRIFFHFAPSP